MALYALNLLPLEALRTLGTLDALTFHALRAFRPLEAPPLRLEALPLHSLRALGALNTLTLDLLRPFGALNPLALDTMRTLGPLALNTLRAFSALSTLTLSPLWTICSLGALSLPFLALARLRAGVPIAIAALGACRSCQRQGCHAGDQCQLASHLLLLA